MCLFVVCLLEDNFPRLWELEGQQASAHQCREGQQDGDDLGDCHKLGEDEGADDGC